MIAQSADLLAQLPLTDACALLEVGRGSYYRATARTSEAWTASQAETALQAALEGVIEEYPGYGYPRVTQELRRRGWSVNPKRIYRLMAIAGLLQPRRRRLVRTTNSEHGLPVYPNLLPQCGWRQLTGPDQAWGADLTYVRLGEGFCYLAVLLDLFSRKIVGWHLSRSLEAQGALTALEQALAQRRPPSGWIHHSDRGVQYACREYVQRLKQTEARISMAAVGAPKENALAERVIRTLKEEEVDLQDYRSFREAEQSIRRFIDAVYNEKRLHSALGYRPPTEFEELFAAGLIN